MRAPYWLVPISVIACGRVGFSPTSERVDDGGTGDAAPACVVDKWTDIVHLGDLSSDGDDWEAALSPDGRVLVYSSGPPGAARKLFVSVRASSTATFGSAEPIDLGTAPDIGEYSPLWSADGKRLFYVRNPPYAAFVVDHLGDGTFESPVQSSIEFPGENWEMANGERELFYTVYTDQTGTDTDLLYATRSGLNADWQPAPMFDDVNRLGKLEGWPAFDEARQQLYIEHHDDSGAAGIGVATRAGPGEPFGAFVRLELGSDAGDPEVSRDGLTLVFSSSDRPDSFGKNDLYLAKRDCP